MGKALSSDAVFWEVSGQKKLRWHRLSRTLGRVVARAHTVNGENRAALREALAKFGDEVTAAGPTTKPANVVQLPSRFSGRDPVDDAEMAAPKVELPSGSTAAVSASSVPTPSSQIKKQILGLLAHLLTKFSNVSTRRIVCVVAAVVVLGNIGFTMRRSTAQWKSRAQTYQADLKKFEQRNTELSKELKADSDKITNLQGQLGYTKDTNGLVVHVTNLAQTAATSAASCNQKNQAALSEIQKYAQHGSSASAVKAATKDASTACSTAQDDMNAFQTEVNSLQH